MTSTDIIIPTAASTIAMINDFALAIATNRDSDSTNDDSQLGIDCILFPDSLPADLLDDAAYAPLTPALLADTYFTLDDIRAYATAAFNLRP